MYCHCSHYVKEETEKLSRLPEGVGFGHRLSDSRALALAITVRRAEGEGRCRLERCPVRGVKGMLVALTDNPWNVSS